MALLKGTRLGGRYEIQSALGAGGMGEVYRATDLRLARDVAIKVLPEHLSQNSEAMGRFEREAKALAALSHPNILAIHDFVTDEDISFAVMELLEGVTLRGSTASSRFSWEKAVRIATDVTEGLSAAHSKGIIHRDIKPENIFITSNDQVKILDFGLARLNPLVKEQELSVANTVTAQTQAGVVMGTMPYMSPEQVNGVSVDHRSDIFSFGSVLYEMISGNRAFGRPTAAQTIAAILKEQPLDLNQSGIVIPGELQRLINRCLEKNPDDRYQSARDLAYDLKTIISSPSQSTATPARSPQLKKPILVSAVLFLLLVFAGITYFLIGRGSPIQSIAVLPFRNDDPNPESEYLSDGITESIINNLSQFPQLRVMARDTVFTYKQKQLEARKIGRELKVTAVLTGRILQQGDVLVIRAELVDVSEGTQLWGEQYSEKFANVLEIQEKISRKISEKLQLKLTSKEQKALLKHPTENAEAYQLYIQGLYYWHQATLEGYEKSIQFYRQAIEKDSNYALAYAGLARAIASGGVDGFWASAPACSEAKSAVNKAMQLDPELAETRIALGLVYSSCDWNLERGLKEWQRGVEASPNNADFRRYYSQLLAAAGRFGEAITEGKKAVQLDPLSWDTNKGLGTTYLWEGKYDDAIAQYKKALELDPSPVQLHLLLADTFARKGMNNEAIAEHQRALTLMDSAEAAEALGEDYATLGYQKAMQNFYRNYLEYVKESSQESYVSPYTFALLHALLHEKEDAFEWLEKAYAERSQQLLYIKVTPELDSLRADPRFSQLVRRIGLPV